MQRPRPRTDTDAATNALKGKLAVEARMATPLVTAQKVQQEAGGPSRLEVITTPTETKKARRHRVVLRAVTLESK